MNKIKLIDYLTINPDPTLSNLGKREKIELIDSLVSTDNSRGLRVTYDLSHSGRRINNRIYPTKGQKEGISTVTSPYPKPILVHHDGQTDPIGRFTMGKWDDLSSMAVSFFDDINDFMELKAAYDSDEPSRIYTAMKKFNLLTDRNWPGLGRMRVQASINDELAIEKFLDGRYITFSAGSTTDRHVCSICESDWSKGDLCEHRHGKIYDGDICVFITGTFEVLEGSVVNMPADDLSQVLSMEMTGSPNSITNNSDKFTIDRNTIYLSDSTYHITENDMSEHVLESVDNTENDHVSTDTSSEDATAELQSETSKEVAQEVAEAANDEIEAVQEELLQVSEEGESESATESTDEVTEETDKNSTNGNIEGTEEDVVEETSKEDAFNTIITKVVEELKAQGLVASAADETTEAELVTSTETETSENKEETIPTDADDENTPCTGSDIEVGLDWYLLSLALAAQLGTETVNTDELQALSDDKFCGPNRTFPICNKEYAAAAMVVVENSQLSDEQRVHLIATIGSIADINDSENENLYTELKQDHLSALKKIDNLELALSNSIDRLAKLLGDDLVNCEDVNAKMTWLESINDSKEENPAINVENPSIASSGAIVDSPKSDLGDYEKVIVDSYKNILLTNGTDAAESFFASKMRYLPRGFHPNNFIGD